MDERVLQFVCIGAVLLGLIGAGIGAIIWYFTGAPAWIFGALIGAGLGGFIGWFRES